MHCICHTWLIPTEVHVFVCNQLVSCAENPGKENTMTGVNVIMSRGGECRTGKCTTIKAELSLSSENMVWCQKWGWWSWYCVVVLQSSDLFECPVNPGHSLTHRSLDAHLRYCPLVSKGYSRSEIVSVRTWFLCRVF